jgi:hypothetical protein
MSRILKRLPSSTVEAMMTDLKREEHNERVDRVLDATIGQYSKTINPGNLRIVLKVLLDKLTDDELRDLFWSVRE